MIILDKLMNVLDAMKKFARVFVRWLLVAEIFSILVLFLAYFIPDISTYIGSESKVVSLKEIVYEMTSRGEALLLFIPLIASLILELYERKVQIKFSLFVLYFLIVLLVSYGLLYPVILKGDKKIELVLITAIIPLITLNISAIFVKAIPDKENIELLS